MQRKVTCIVLILFLTGCGLRFVYNNLDFFVQWKLDDFVELTTEQERTFELAFNKVHLWHRTQQLPLYIEHLRNIKQQVADGITESEIEDSLGKMQSYWQNVLEYSHESLVDVTSMLNEEQREELNRNIAKDIEENLDEHENLTRVAWLEKRMERQEKGYKKWVGKLTNTQIIALTKIANGYQDSFHQWIDFRKQWALAFKKALSPNNTYPTYENEFSQLIINSHALRSSSYQETMANNRQVFIKSLHYLLHNLTDKQRKKLNDKIDELIDDLTELNEDSID